MPNNFISFSKISTRLTAEDDKGKCSKALRLRNHLLETFSLRFL